MQPVLVLDLIKENISYFTNKKEIAKNFLTVFYQNDTQERYEVLVSSQNEREAETFAYYLNKLINDGKEKFHTPCVEGICFQRVRDLVSDNGRSSYPGI